MISSCNDVFVQGESISPNTVETAVSLFMFSKTTEFLCMRVIQDAS